MHLNLLLSKQNVASLLNKKLQRCFLSGKRVSFLIARLVECDLPQPLVFLLLTDSSGWVEQLSALQLLQHFSCVHFAPIPFALVSTS